MKIIVAAGRRVTRNVITPAFNWNIHWYKFQFNFKLLELGSFDMILGVDWMHSFNPILFDFHNANVTIQRAGKEVILQGIKGVRAAAKLL